MKEVRITVDMGRRRPGSYEVALQLDDNVTCGDVLQLLVESLALKPRNKKEEWRLVECWRGCQCAIPAKQQLVPLYAAADREEVKVYLKRDSLPPNKRKYTKKIKQALRRGPISSKRLTRRKLCCMYQLLQKELLKRRKRYRNILFKRLAAREPLWIAGEMTQLDLLHLELAALRDNNLDLSSQVADLNITSTELRNQLNLLRQRSLTLSDQLNKLEEEVKMRKEERERQGPRNMAQVQTEIIKLRRELEVRNRLNASQNAKLKTQKELLSEKQQLLAEKKKELEQVKLAKPNQQTALGDSHVTYKSPDRRLTSQGGEFSIRHTTSLSVSARRDNVQSSASKKRHSSIFEVKTRQLIAEESQAFRQLQSKRLEFNAAEGDDTIKRSPAHLPSSPEVKTETTKVESLSTGAGLQTTRKILKKSRAKAKSTKHVRFTADSIILNTALEGDLDTLKECTRKLGSCLQTSDKGATCLHNAVCSGNIDVVNYLVEQGCSVNAQDIDGWTPLHCAAAYGNLEMMKFLVHQGASFFIQTNEGDTPLKILREDYKTLKEEDKDKNIQLVACLSYLTDLQRELGVSNNGIVYTLFSRQAKDVDELAFVDGEQLQVLDQRDREQWWLAQNISGEQGLVPMTFLGPYKPPNVGTLL